MLTNDQFIEVKEMFSNNQCIEEKKKKHIFSNDYGIVFYFYLNDHGIGGLFWAFRS